MSHDPNTCSCCTGISPKTPVEITNRPGLNAISYRRGEERKEIVVDAAGYRERRRATLESLALRTAEQVRASGEPAGLEPMTAVERKVVHLALKERAGVETRSEGTEPNRYVVVVPAG